MITPRQRSAIWLRTYLSLSSKYDTDDGEISLIRRRLLTYPPTLPRTWRPTHRLAPDPGGIRRWIRL